MKRVPLPPAKVFSASIHENNLEQVIEGVNVNPKNFAGPPRPIPASKG